MKSVAIICLSFLAVVSIKAEIPPETMGKIIQTTQTIIKKCREDTNANEDDLSVLSEMKPPSTREAKCMLACFIREAGIEFDGNKVTDKHGFVDIIKKEDPELYNMGFEIIKACHEEVPKLDDECEYHGKLFECHIKKVKETDFPPLPIAL